ncbi:hypothetical protein [Streptomyces sp. Amel2xC10]|uniref:hypothetical protein n=1 Tax=Streptomyces sp. Amel2xC10 TaxID=1305826 RepID=UPI000A0824CA|nr:hypothetical protein [Streptomyces sp. Amel2xC10]SMF85996.1 hypothetical protein SAMN02745830_07100 [Streptomyces sp. Amel2xC10]
MKRHTARSETDHQHAASQARQMPGQWVLAGRYGSGASATSAALQVRTAEKLPAYRPPGSFEGRARLTEDGADLWVRYLDQSARDFRDSVSSGLTESFDHFSRRLDAAATATTRRT